MDMGTKVISAGEKQSRKKLWPIIFILAVIPLLMYVYEYNTGLGKYMVYSAAEPAGMEAALAIKEYALIVIGIIMAVILIADNLRYDRKISFHWSYLPVGGYLILALLSSCTAESKQYAFFGGYEQFQGFFALLTYGIAILYAVQYIRDLDDVKYIMKRFLIGVAVMCVIGVIQFFGGDPLKLPLIRYLITPIKYWNDVNWFGGNDLAHYVSLTLYNPNYVGSYVALVLPIALVLIYLSQKMKNIVYYILIAAGLLVALVGSGSATGMIGVISGILLFLILMRKPLMKKWYFTAPAVLGIIVVCFLPFVRNKVNVVLDSMKTKGNTSYNLTDIRTNDNDVEIDYKGNTLILSTISDGDSFSIVMTDQNHSPVESTCDVDYLYTLNDERFSGIQIQPEMPDGHTLFMVVTIDGGKWWFTNEANGENTYYYYDHVAGCLAKVTSAESIGFKGHELFATGRGYLWSRTLPLLKHTIIYGYGPDNFVLKFPADDYVMKSNVGFGNDLTTRPHNMYLQMAVETGVLSVICFLVFYLAYFIMSIKLYIKRVDDHKLKKYGVGILVGTFGYVITGLANDSMIVVAPVFWVMIGIGIAINLLLQKELKH